MFENDEKLEYMRGIVMNYIQMPLNKNSVVDEHPVFGTFTFEVERQRGISQTIDMRKCAATDRAYIEKYYERWLNECDDVFAIMQIVKPVFHLDFVANVYDEFSPRFAGHLIAKTWKEAKAPNDMSKLPLILYRDMFLYAGRENLMTPAESKYYENLPSVVSIYRGISKYNYENGLSYTDSYEDALRYAGEDGKVLSRKIQKEKILACFINEHGIDIVTSPLDIEKA